MKITEGYMPFKGFQTYYRIVGEATDKAPLLLLHGGPGSTHNYFEVLDCLAQTGRQVISYDQIGCGKSFVSGHPELFTLDVWTEELVALREHLHLDRVHILGQSWGGMMLIAYLIDHQPEGVASAILASTLSDSQLWGREQHRMIGFMSSKDQAAIARAEATGDYTQPDYLEANDHFMEQHCAPEVNMDSPECLRREKQVGNEAYVVAWGPNEYTPMGNLKHFDYTARLGEISCPCLITSGTNDMCTPLVAKTMYDRIPHAAWHLFDGTRHMSFVEQHQRYCEVLSQWLEKHEEGK